MPPTLPDDGFERGIGRVWGLGEEVMGSGFLLAADLFCTCAHVVARALGTGDTGAEPPSDPLAVDFPLPHPAAHRVRAHVVRWTPVLPDGSGDLALLRLERIMPGTAPVRLAGGDDFWDHRFRVLGFPRRTEDHGVWVQGRLRGRVGRGWISMETRESLHGPAVGQGFSGAPVWDIEQGGVVGMTVAADRGDGATTAYLIPAARLLDAEPLLRGNPFRGLEAFREEDAGIFFGRRSDSERIARAVRTEAFVPVAGASGVGKSSLVRAGVLPLLRAAGYTVTDFTGQPGASPVRVLFAALRNQFPRDTALRELADGVRGHVDEGTAVLIGARVLEHSGPAGHVVLLDQFEETVGVEPARARRLLDVLLVMTRARDARGRRLRVLATLRSASLEELVAGGEAERLSVTVQMVAPMVPEQLAEAVGKPVAAVPGVDFEPDLAERIVADAGTEPGALPLMEFVLARLWDHRDRGRLTHAAYRRLGGVEGALAGYADQQLAEVCKAPGSPGDAVVRRLFEQLALPDSDQGYARVARAYDGLSEEQRVAAQALAATRLLVVARDSTGRETVALAHESLVRQWPTLRGWLDDSRAFRMWQERLRGRMREWEEQGRHTELLLRGQESLAASGWARKHAGELLGAEAEYIELSRRQERRTVRRGRAVGAVMTALVVVAGLLGLLITTSVREAERRDEREAADLLAEEAEKRFVADPVEGAVLALRAYRTAATEKTHRALLRMYLPMSSVTVLDGDFVSGTVTDAAASADGAVAAVLTEDEDGAARGTLVTGIFTQRPKKLPISGIPEHADKVAVSDDGRRVAVAAADGAVGVWRTDAVDTPSDQWVWDTAELSATEDGEAYTMALDLSADGREVLHLVNGPVGTSDCYAGADWARRLYLRQLDTGSRRNVPRATVPEGACLIDAALPAGSDSHVVTLTEDGPDGELRELRISRLSTGVQERTWPGAELASIGPGGRALGVRPADVLTGGYREPGTGERRRNAGAYRAEDRDVTGRFTLETSGVAQLWHDSVNGAEYVTSLPAVPLDLGASFHAFGTVGRDGPQFRALIGGRLVRLRARRTPPTVVRHTEEVVPASFTSPGGSLVALVTERSADESLYRNTLVLLGHGRTVRRQLGPGDLAGGSATHLAVSGDGRNAVVWGDRGWALYRLTREEAVLVQHRRDPRQASPGEQLVRDVQPLGGHDFLLLGRHGVRRLDGTSGGLSSSRGSRCDERDVQKPRFCVALAVAPGQDTEALVLQGNGRVRLWNLADGSPGRSADLGGSPTGGSGAVRFRDDGARVAAAVGQEEVVVWDPKTDRRTRLRGEGYPVIALYGRDGLLVLLGRDSAEFDAELWSERGKEPVGYFEPFSGSGAWRLAGGAVHGGTDWGTWRLPLGQPSLAAGLCRALGDYDPPTLREDLPPAANEDAPCPKRG